MSIYYQDEQVTLYHGDALEVLRGLPDESVHAVVTDPPAGISFMGKEWDGAKGGREQWSAWLAEVMREAYRVTKPGGHALVWALPRTSHWTACGLEDAGWEIRDKIVHLFGSGFPKSLDVSKAIDKAARGVPQGGVDPTSPNHGMYRTTTTEGKRWDGDSGQGYGAGGSRFLTEAGRASGSATAHVESGAAETATSPVGHGVVAEAAPWQGWGTALKPAAEDWWLARKPLAGTVAANVLQHGTGALNIDATRIATDERMSYSSSTAQGAVTFGTGTTEQNPAGRWPTNVVLDDRREPVLRLRYNLPVEVERTIRESFGASTDHLPAVRDEHVGAAEQGGAAEVLQSQVPRGVDVGEHDGREGASVGQATYTGDASANLSDEAGESTERPEGSQLEGRPLPQSGICVREAEHPAAARAGDVQVDVDPQRRDLHPGAPAGRSATPRASADPRGARAPHQRTQGGQPTGEPGAPRVEQLAPDEARGSRRRDVPPTPGERAATGAPLEVLRRECPPGWWHYFDVVGHRREGQAAALDEQSGELHPPGTRSMRPDRGPFSRGEGVVTPQAEVINDTGGASRFFPTFRYEAKAPTSERPRYTRPMLRLRGDLTPAQVDHVRARLAKAGVQVD